VSVPTGINNGLLGPVFSEDGNGAVEDEVLQEVLDSAAEVVVLLEGLEEGELVILEGI